MARASAARRQWARQCTTCTSDPLRHSFLAALIMVSMVGGLWCVQRVERGCKLHPVMGAPAVPSLDHRWKSDDSSWEARTAAMQGLRTHGRTEQALCCNDAWALHRAPPRPLQRRAAGAWRAAAPLRPRPMLASAGPRRGRGPGCPPVRARALTGSRVSHRLLRPHARACAGPRPMPGHPLPGPRRL